MFFLGISKNPSRDVKSPWISTRPHGPSVQPFKDGIENGSRTGFRWAFKHGVNGVKVAVPIKNGILNGFHWEILGPYLYGPYITPLITL